MSLDGVNGTLSGLGEPDPDEEPSGEGEGGGGGEGAAAETGTLAGDFREPDQLRAAGRAERVDAPDLEIEREVARGGMGVVWLARQASLGRVVALKTLRADLGSPAAAEKFEAEALVTGRLEHPNIPPVHAYGRDATGRPFLCMKLVKGIEWAKLLDPKTPEERDRAAGMDLRAHLDVLERVCEAIAFAHSRGVIHRDLKPENVMVGEFDEVLVMDWGIALELSGGGEARTRTGTETGTGTGAKGVVGTPAYMPPEMAAGDEARQGPWTDVYLLGAILYEILTGAPPHRGASVIETLLAAREGKVEPPQRRVLRLRSGQAPIPEVPEPLAEAAMKALDPDPEKRFRGARELEAAILEYLRNEASLKIAKAALAELAGIERDVVREGRPPVEVYPAFAACIAKMQQAEDLWAGNRAAREGLGRARAAYADYAIGRGDLSLAEAQAAQLEPESPRAGELRGRIAAIRAAREAAERRRRLILSVLVALLLVVAWLGFEQARARRRRNEAVGMTDGITWLAPAERIKIYEGAVRLDPTWPEGWSELARTHILRATELYLTNPTGCAEHLRAALPLLDRAIELEPDNEIVYNDRAWTLAYLGDFRRAIPDFRRSIELAPDSHSGLDSEAALALAEGRFADSEAASTRALQKKDANEGNWFMRALARYVLGKYDGALEDIRKAHKTAARGEDDWYDALEALILLAQGERRRAAERVVSGIELFPRSALLLPLAAYLAALEGDLERARALEVEARKARAIYERAFLCIDPVWTATRRAAPPHDQAGRAILLELNLEAVAPKGGAPLLALRRRGEERLARGEAEPALADAQLVLGEDPSDGSARLLRALSAIALGHPEAARADLVLVERLAPNRAAEARAALGRVESGGK